MPLAKDRLIKDIFLFHFLKYFFKILAKLIRLLNCLSYSTPGLDRSFVTDFNSIYWEAGATSHSVIPSVLKQAERDGPFFSYSQFVKSCT